MEEFKETTHGDSTVIELAGKLDASTTPIIEEKLSKMIQEGKKYLILDFGGVTYFASSGLKMLLFVIRQIKKLDGGLVVCALTPKAQSILEVTGFLPHFKLTSTSAEALKLLDS